MKKLTRDRVVPVNVGEGLLTDLGDYSLGYSFLAEVGEQQQEPSQPLLAEIEELIDQVLLSDVPCQQMRYEQIGECVFPVKRTHHRLLVNAQQFAVRHCSCRPHA